MSITQSYADFAETVWLEREARARMHRAAQAYLELWSRKATSLSCLNPAKAEALAYGLGLESPEDLAARINEGGELSAGYEAYVRHGKRTLDPDFIGIGVKAAVPIS